MGTFIARTHLHTHTRKQKKEKKKLTSVILKKMSSSTAMYASLSILSLCALTGTGVAIGSSVGMMSMAALEAEKKDTVAHSVKETSWAASKQVSGAPARGFAAAVGRQ